MVGHYFFKIVEALFLGRGLSQDRGHFSTKPSLFIFVVGLFSTSVELFSTSVELFQEHGCTF